MMDASQMSPTFAGTLTVNPPVAFPLLEVIIIQLLALHLLDLVLANTLPHDIRDRGGDQTKMDVNLHSTNKSMWQERQSM